MGCHGDQGRPFFLGGLENRLRGHPAPEEMARRVAVVRQPEGDSAQILLRVLLVAGRDRGLRLQQDQLRLMPVDDAAQVGKHRLGGRRPIQGDQDPAQSWITHRGPP